MARIVIDCRLWGVKHTGLGRYTENLVKNMLELDKINTYALLVRAEDKREMVKLFPSVDVVEVEARHYTVAEQILLPFILLKLRSDLIHVPHFNIPVFWFGNTVVTIHDLITHEFKGRRQTTLPVAVYWAKYVVHQFVFWLAVKRARRIVVPTRWAKDTLVARYGVWPGKITVTPEAVDSVYFKKKTSSQRDIVKRFGLKDPFLIYTGNTYEHKNLRRLVMAVKGLRMNLAIACARSVFRNRFEKEVASLGASKRVKFLGEVDDADLRDLYRRSLAFVTPSLSEGFGLSGLEAMAAGTVILSSNASCLPEVYGDCAVYFDPFSIDDMREKVGQVESFSGEERSERIAEGIRYAKGFSWRETARLTLEAYEEVLGD